MTSAAAANFPKNPSIAKRKSTTSSESSASSSSVHSMHSDNALPPVSTSHSSTSSSNNNIYSVDDLYKIIQAQQTTINKLSQEVKPVGIHLNRKNCSIELNVFF